jgi:hypothetical protein
MTTGQQRARSRLGTAGAACGWLSVMFHDLADLDLDTARPAE